MHFEKQHAEGNVRVELLTGPISDAQREHVRVRKTRVRPKGDVELHAYLTPEALAFEVAPIDVTIVSGRSVSIPNAFSFLLMKLHACRDRLDDEDKQLGRHHALDVYRIIAMLTEDELALVKQLVLEHREATPVREAARIAKDLFGDITARGVLRMREHELAHGDFQIPAVLDVLEELFRGVDVAPSSEAAVERVQGSAAE